MEVRLEVRDHGVFLQHRETFRSGDRVRGDVERRRARLTPDARKAHEIAALLWLFAFRIEPEANLRTAGDLLADRVNVLIPRDFLARHDKLARTVSVSIVALADRPFHQERPTIDEVFRAGGGA